MNQTIRSLVSTSYKETLSSANIGFDAFDFLPYDRQIKHVEHGEKVTEAFTTKELGEEAGLNLNYFGARYYDPDVALWTSVDAARQFHSPYSYGNDPINSIDPDGNVSIKYRPTGFYIDKYDYNTALANTGSYEVMKLFANVITAGIGGIAMDVASAKDAQAKILGGSSSIGVWVDKTIEASGGKRPGVGTKSLYGLSLIFAISAIEYDSPDQLERFDELNIGEVRFANRREAIEYAKENGFETHLITNVLTKSDVENEEK